MGVLRSTKVAMTEFELTPHTTVGRVGYPLNLPGDRSAPDMYVLRSNYITVDDPH